MTDDIDLRPSFLACTVEIVCAFVSNNAIPAGSLPDLIGSTFAAVERTIVGQAAALPAPATPAQPAVALNKSITDDHLVCLEDGKTFKSLKRHLRTHYNLSPAEYRQKWGLASDYPMVAPNYAKARSALAKTMGLGTQRKKTPAEAA